MADNTDVLRFGDVEVRPGERVKLELPVAELFTHTVATMPIEVVRGRRPGPTLFVCAAIHGDEINGIEIVRRLLAYPKLNSLRGTLIAVPIVNVQGFLNQSRYSPDRRDLNRCFPGSARGSVAGRLAWLFSQEIVAKSDYGIDLHTGAIHRANLPQIRAALDSEKTLELARAFAAPVTLNADLRDGSLRQFAFENDIPILVFEGGEALRFDETSIRVGLKGTLNVMRQIGMLPKRKTRERELVIARSSSWLRAEQSGIFRPYVGLGANVSKGEVLAVIADPVGQEELEMKAHVDGVVIGRSNLPLVNEGDAVFHIAKFASDNVTEKVVDNYLAEQEGEPPAGMFHPPVI